MKRSVAGLLAIILLLPLTAHAEQATVTVRGEAEIRIPADRAIFDLAVVTEAANPEKALQMNSDRIEKVIDALQRAGLAEKEIATGQFTVNPRWSHRPRQSPEDWKPEIIGYTVTNRLEIKTLKLDLVGKLLAAAIGAGANDVNNLAFDLSNARSFRQEAIRIATERAQEDARVLADAAGAALGDTVSLHLDDARPMPVMLRRDFVAETAAVSAPPVMPGEVTVRATVTAVFELAKSGE